MENFSRSAGKGLASLLLAGSLAFNAFAQEQSRNLGKVSDFYKSVSITNQRTSNEKNIPGLESDLTTIINVDKTEDGAHKVIGEIKGSQASSITFTITNGILEGTAVMPDKHIAYKYSTDASGNVIVKSADINKIICVDYDQHPSQKNKRTEATTAIPPSTSPVYKYQSLPGVVSVAYLDVDGEVVTGTSWAGGATINAVPMNLSEADVTTIWKVVSEDLRAFNINVTTDRAIFDAAPKNKRIMCILTTTNTAAPGSGGVAYLNSFSANNDNPCWVYNTGAKTAGETSSHEIGHTLGLAHDGNASTTYYSGHGDWAPIMGSSYSRPIGQWSIGEYTGANNQEDDIAIIAGTRNGFGFRTDEAGSTNATAKALVVSGTSVVSASNYGIITNRTDIDVYSFATGGGNVTLTVNPFELYPDLDVLLTLTNSSGTVVATANPTTSMSATITATLAAGTYYLAVDGTGNGNPLNTGYSDYSSIGGYNISGTVPTGTVPNTPPVVSITSPVNNAKFTAPASITINANATDSDGSVTKVDFYNGSVLIGTDNTSPYSFSWTGVAAGTYNLTARATDNVGAVTVSVAVTVIVNPATNVAPLVNITSPANNAQFTAPASITINANATDSDGSVTKVDFYSGTILIGTDNTSPYSFSWTGVVAGTYSLTAKATDNAGAVTTSAIVSVIVNPAGNVAPIVSITSPASNAQFTAPANITITANATDSDGSVTKVEFYNGTALIGTDLTAPYSVTWNNVGAGTANLIAKATDNAGAVTTSAVVAIVINPAVVNFPPVVSITSPANNAQFTAPANITITANATDSDGAVIKVDFYYGSTLIATDNAVPFSISWTGVAAGTYNLTAKATDNLGGVTTSSVVIAKVNPVVEGCSFPQYVQNGGYNAGDKVKNVGNIYQVRPWPYSGWANGEAWAYAPGTGLYWTDAWTLLGPCTAAAELAQAAAETPRTVVAVYNLQGQQVDASYEGLKIIRYSDGSTEKVLSRVEK